MYDIYTVYNLCVTRALRKQTLDYKNLRRVIGYRISDFGVERSHPEAKRKPNKPVFNRESSYIIRSIQKWAANSFESLLVRVERSKTSKRLKISENQKEIRNTNTELDSIDSKYYSEIRIKSIAVETAYFVISETENRTK